MSDEITATGKILLVRGRYVIYWNTFHKPSYIYDCKTEMAVGKRVGWRFSRIFLVETRAAQAIWFRSYTNEKCLSVIITYSPRDEGALTTRRQVQDVDEI